MIQFPRRSVTRFFIPLIDVLTLLFCIFLLMPMIKATGEAQESASLSAPDLTLGDATSQGDPSGEGRQGFETSALSQRGQQRLELASLGKRREELEQLRTEKIEVLQQRLYIRVLEIDADTGKLFYREPDGVREIASQADALDLIRRHLREAGRRELYY